MSKRKKIGVPAGPHIEIQSIAECIKKSLTQEGDSVEAVGGDAAQLKGESYQGVHRIKLEFEEVPRDYTVVLPGMTKVHELTYKDLAADYTDVITASIYTGKGAVALLVHTVGEYNDEECDAYLNVELTSVTIGHEAKEATKRYAYFVNDAIGPALLPDAVPVILDACVKLLGNKKNRAALRHAVPSIKKVASLLKAA